MSQLGFSLLKVVDKGPMVCAAPTGGGGAISGRRQFLAAITHQGDRGGVPFIGPAEWGFVDLVVPFDTYGY
jgi:hypothetical protein